MTSDSIDWDEDLPADPEEEYQTFVRTLERTEGFRLLFVQCTPTESEQLIARVKEDLPQKTIELLPLDKPIDNLYKIVERLPNRAQINILFVQGLEHSFYEYEELKFGNTHDRNFYSWEGTPKILNHLNQQRERFRDDFKICFVFLLSSFALQYFIHRAPDFFDWRSSVFEFPTQPELLEQELSRILLEGDYEKYLTLTSKERIQEVLEIQERLEEAHQTPRCKARLLFALGDLLSSAKEYKIALANYDQALKIEQNNYEGWYSRGFVIANSRNYEEAIISFDKSLAIKQDSYKTWYIRGIVLDHIGRYEEATVSYDKALELKPDDYQAWNAQGCTLLQLGRYTESLTSCDKSLKLKPDFPQAWCNRGRALHMLSRLEEAIASFKKAIELQPDYYQAWASLSNALAWLDRRKYNKEVISSSEKAIQLFQPETHEDWIWQGLVLTNLGCYEEAINSSDKAIELKSNDFRGWNIRGLALLRLGRYKEAIINYYNAVLAFEGIRSIFRLINGPGTYWLLILKKVWVELLKMIGFKR
jgi:tetratricopeptide (TPR) repeat protein